MTEGRFLQEGKSEALVEAAYARQFGIKVGDTISVADRKFPVVGLVDASQAAKIAVANVYLPLAEAQNMAASSKQLQSVSPFAPGDVNLLFIKADQEKITASGGFPQGHSGQKGHRSHPGLFPEASGQSLCPVG